MRILVTGGTGYLGGAIVRIADPPWARTCGVRAARVGLWPARTTD